MNLILRKVLLAGMLSIAIGCASAQVFVETYPASTTSDMGVRISGLGNLSDRLSYDKITGSPFWSDDWQLASLYGSNAKDHWLCKVKLNFATGEVYYLDKDSNEQVTNDELIKRIVFHKTNDTSAVVAVFILNPLPTKLNMESRSTYLQVLNAGSYGLLKLSKKTLSSADSLFGTLKRYFFTTENNYFVYHNDRLSPLKKLDKDNVLSLVPGSLTYADWAKQNKINFKKEEDVLSFINYYNSQK